MLSNREKIVELARSFIGVKWLHQGRNPDSGLDCAGLVSIVYNRLGLMNYDTFSYNRRPQESKFLHHFRFAGFRDINPLQSKDGDVVIFQENGFPCHCGILAGNNVIHAYALRRKIVEELMNEDYKKRVVTVFSIPGLD